MAKIIICPSYYFWQYHAKKQTSAQVIIIYNVHMYSKNFIKSLFKNGLRNDLTLSKYFYLKVLPMLTTLTA